MLRFRLFIHESAISERFLRRMQAVQVIAQDYTEQGNDSTFCRWLGLIGLPPSASARYT
jgi:hypothetical protein